MCANMPVIKTEVDLDKFMTALKENVGIAYKYTDGRNDMLVWFSAKRGRVCMRYRKSKYRGTDVPFEHDYSGVQCIKSTLWVDREHINRTLTAARATLQ